jgi:hypothetical protein
MIGGDRRHRLIIGATCLTGGVGSFQVDVEGAA